MEDYIKKLTSFVTAIALTLAMPLSVSAASLKTGSVKYNGSYSDRISNTESGHTSTLTAQYFYGATSSDKADMICTYSYNDPLGYKYATINNNGTVYGGANIDGKTDVQVVQTSEVRFVSSNTAVVYHGYVKSSRTGETIVNVRIIVTLD